MRLGLINVELINLRKFVKFFFCYFVFGMNCLFFLLLFYLFFGFYLSKFFCYFMKVEIEIIRVW